jgi:hypothetical protein|tara:strand:- start:334 stop:594 length:261 start_codon:yes stop_codon:yes gene_type:complete
MSDGTQAKLEARKEALVDEFQILSKEGATLIEQGKEMNRRISTLQARQVEIRGALHEVRSLLGEDTSKPLEVKEEPQEEEKEEEKK